MNIIFDPATKATFFSMSDGLRMPALEWHEGLALTVGSGGLWVHCEDLTEMQAAESAARAAGETPLWYVIENWQGCVRSEGWQLTDAGFVHPSNGDHASTLVPWLSGTPEPVAGMSAPVAPSAPDGTPGTTDAPAEPDRLGALLDSYGVGASSRDAALAELKGVAAGWAVDADTPEFAAAVATGMADAAEELQSALSTLRTVADAAPGQMERAGRFIGSFSGRVALADDAFKRRARRVIGEWQTWAEGRSATVPSFDVPAVRAAGRRVVFGYARYALSVASLGLDNCDTTAADVTRVLNAAVGKLDTVVAAGGRGLASGGAGVSVQ